MSLACSKSNEIIYIFNHIDITTGSQHCFKKTDCLQFNVLKYRLSHPDTSTISLLPVREDCVGEIWKKSQ